MFFFDVPAGWLSLLNPWWIHINLGLIAGLITLAYVTYHHAAMGVAGIAAALPLYLARARFGWLPTTYLELALVVALASWLASAIRHRRWQQLTDPLRGPIVLLLSAGTMALLWSPDLSAAAGLWKAYLVEPILLYWFARQTLQTAGQRRAVLVALGVSAMLVAGLVILQWGSGVGIAEPGWVRLDRRRATGLYTSPNAVGLYLGPIVALLLGWAAAAGRRISERLFASAAVLTSLAAIAATKSAGTWLGLAVAAGIYGWRRLGIRRLLIFGSLTLAVMLAWPPSRAVIASQFYDPAWTNRITLWQGTMQYLTASPRRFTTGAGIAGFSRMHDQFRNPRQSEPLIYPHHLLLNFWVEYGILGLVAIAWLAARVMRINFGLHGDGVQGGALLALATLLGHGLVDVPYFKNDLAMLSWLLVALALSNIPAKNQRNLGTSPPTVKPGPT